MATNYGIRMNSSGSTYNINDVRVIITGCDYLYVDGTKYTNSNGKISMVSYYNATTGKYYYFLSRYVDIAPSAIISHSGVSSAETHTYQIYGKNMSFYVSSNAGTATSITGYVRPTLETSYSVNEGDTLLTTQTVGFQNSITFYDTVTKADIVLGVSTLNDVETIRLTDAANTSDYVNFTYGTYPLKTVNVKVGDNTLTNVDTIRAVGADNVYKEYGYKQPDLNYQATLTLNASCSYAIWDGKDFNGKLLALVSDTAPHTFTINSGHMLVVMHSSYYDIMSYSLESAVNVEDEESSASSILLKVTGTPASVTLNIDED